VSDADRTNKTSWRSVLAYTLVGAILGALFSLAFGYIGAPWQGALVLGLIGGVVGIFQSPLDRAVRKAVHRHQ